VLPGQLVPHPGPPRLAQHRPPPRVPKQRVDGARVLLDVPRPGVGRGALGDTAGLWQVEGHDRHAERHVLHHLHRRDLELQAGVQAQVRRGQVLEHRLHRQGPGELHPLVQVQLAGQRAGLLQVLAEADDGEPAVRAAQLVHQVLDRAQQQVEPVLPAHEAHPAGQEPLPLPQLGVAPHPGHPGQHRAVPDHRDALRADRAQVKRPLAQVAVHAGDPVGPGQAQPLHPPEHREHRRPGLAVARRVELGQQVALVHQDPDAERAADHRQREVQVRWLAELHHVRPLAYHYPKREPRRGQQRVRVLAEIADPPAGLGRRTVLKQPQPGVAPLLGPWLGPPGDRHDPVPGLQQRRDLLGDPVVGERRHVLHDDQDPPRAPPPTHRRVHIQPPRASVTGMGRWRQADSAARRAGPACSAPRSTSRWRG